VAGLTSDRADDGGILLQQFKPGVARALRRSRHHHLAAAYR